MKLTLSNSKKVYKFTNLFNNLKNISREVVLTFTKEGLHTQGLDSAHVCLFDIRIKAEWFDTYELEDDEVRDVGLLCELIFKLFSCIREGQDLELILTDEKPDVLMVNFINNTNMDKSFEIRLFDIDKDPLELPFEDPDLELIMDTKEFKSLINEMSLFSDYVDFICDSDEDYLLLTGVGDMTGKMSVKIKDGNVEYFGILEDTKLNVRFDTKYLLNIANFEKIASQLHISCSSEKPIILNYILDENIKSDDANILGANMEDYSYIRMVLAPKEVDEDFT
jgi:proliferating cell nuclear antigen PCNA